MKPRPMLPASDREWISRTRRHPSPTQPDYLILRVLVAELERALAGLDPPLGDVLDLYAGTQPYRDLLPPHRSYISMDIDEHYGPQDVVSTEFLPFADESFDVVLFTEAFHYAPEPERAVAELARVVRPGGTVIITLPLIWDYDERIVERRYTGPSLRELFELDPAWTDLELGRVGGYAVAWATISGRIVRGFADFGPPWSRRLGSALLPVASAVMNGISALLARFERRWHTGPFVLPSGLILSARRAAR